jgi:hypothetical protein
MCETAGLIAAVGINNPQEIRFWIFASHQKRLELRHLGSVLGQRGLTSGQTSRCEVILEGLKINETII